MALFHDSSFFQDSSPHFLIFSQKYCQIEIDIGTIMIENNFLNKKGESYEEF